MSYTLIDYFRAFHSLKQTLNLSASAQAIYFSILGEFNVARFPKQLSISDRELKALAGLKSVATAHDAKRILKNVGLVDFTTRQGGNTIYTLATEHLPNSCRTVTEQLPNTPDAVPNIRAREDVKDVKTLDKLLLLLNAGASAGVNRDFENGVTATPVDTPAEPIDTLTEYWERDLHGGRLTIEHLSEIKALIDSHGFDWVKEAMQTAADSNGSAYGVSMKLFRAVVRRKLNPSPKPKPALKGGERDEQRYKPAYKQRTFDLSGTDDTPDWFKSGASASAKQGAF